VITDPEYHFEAVNVEAQQNNPSSLLWWMRRVIALRKRFRAFSRGTIEFLQPDNRKVLVFVREHEDEHILVVANLSRFTQAVELDLAHYEGRVPVELFGHTEFPRIGELPYFLTLGPHTFYWFQLTPERSRERPEQELERPDWPVLTPAGDWKSLLEGEGREELASILPGYLRPRRWFGGKARRIRKATVVDVLNARGGEMDVHLVLARVSYLEGDPETYVIPLAHATGEAAERLMKEQPHAVVCRTAESAVLFDATVEPDFGNELLRIMATRRRLTGDHGDIHGGLIREFRERRKEEPESLRPELVRVEQSNTSVMYGTELFFKLFRKLDTGVNPDLEIPRQLSRQGFEHTPEVTGEVHYRTDAGSSTVGVMKRYVPNEGDAWAYTLDSLGGFFERVLTGKPEAESLRLDIDSMVERAEIDPPELTLDLMGGYRESASLIGRRTAEMHRALADPAGRREFTPEPFSALYQRSLYQSMRNLSGRIFQTLSRELNTLPEDVREGASEVLDRKNEIMQRMRGVVGEKIDAQRIRTHGDYHLGQLLYTGRDFIIIDFEGEPARPLTERRLKRSALSDAAGMLRSFHYAAYTALADEEIRGMARAGQRADLEGWARFWTAWTSAAFLRSYLDEAREEGGRRAAFVPGREDQLRILLQAHLLEKAVYELGYELNNRPDWVRVPVLGIRQLLDDGA
jgi:maltose alpha-D-glucosyltransferase/alpha-amylase